jgi:hypothetical protein
MKGRDAFMAGVGVSPDEAGPWPNREPAGLSPRFMGKPTRKAVGTLVFRWAPRVYVGGLFCWGRKIL